MSVLYLGDSLGVGTSPHFKDAQTDVEVGRRSSEAAARARRQYRGQRKVVFDVGTNDGSAAELRSSIRQLRRVVGKDTQIVMSTVNGPAAKQKNRLLHRLAQKGAIQLFNGRGVELSGDGIHPTGRGYQQRAQSLRRALERADRANPKARAAQAPPQLDPETTLSIDAMRIHGEGIATIRAALAKAGLDAKSVLDAYSRTPFADGRLRGEVNLSDPNEWKS